MSEGKGRGSLGSKKTKTIKSIVNQQEKNLAAKLKGKRQIMSGALADARGDVELEEFLFDAKRTEKKSYVITSQLLRKMAQYALEKDKAPGLLLEFASIQEPYIPKEYAVIPLDMFVQLLNNQSYRNDATESFQTVETESESPLSPDEPVDPDD